MALREEGFWDQHYQEELRNFDDAGDEGEVWFGKGLSRKIVARIIGYLNSDRSYDQLPNIGILDIGCGNAFLLISLVQKAQVEIDENKANKCNYLGLDYSSNSIKLCQKILAAKDINTKLSFNQCDFLNLEQVERATFGKKYEFVIDVGTYDAICLLASQKDDILDRTKRSYMNSIYSVAQQGTVFIFASCNHTRDELMRLFEYDCPSRLAISLIGEIDTPKLSYGGKEGSQVCCLIIKFNSS